MLENVPPIKNILSIFLKVSILCGRSDVFCTSYFFSSNAEETAEDEPERAPIGFGIRFLRLENVPCYVFYS